MLRQRSTVLDKNFNQRHHDSDDHHVNEIEKKLIDVISRLLNSKRANYS